MKRQPWFLFFLNLVFSILVSGSILTTDTTEAACSLNMNACTDPQLMSLTCETGCTDCFLNVKTCIKALWSCTGQPTTQSKQCSSQLITPVVCKCQPPSNFAECQDEGWFWNPYDSTCYEQGVNPECSPEDWGFWHNCFDCQYWCTNCQCLTDSPVVIDVAGNGFDLTNRANGVNFDLNVDGTTEHLAWTSGSTDDAFLVLDRNGNGTIDNGAELFGNHTPQPTSDTPNGFSALAEYDKNANGGNQDGVMDSRDAVFAQLRLWQDSNHNGISEPSELHGLHDLGLETVECDYKLSKRSDKNGNGFRYRAKVRDAKGSKISRWAWDVFFVTN